LFFSWSVKTNPLWKFKPLSANSLSNNCLMCVSILNCGCVKVMTCTIKRRMTLLYGRKWLNSNIFLNFWSTVSLIRYYGSREYGDPYFSITCFFSPCFGTFCILLTIAMFWSNDGQWGNYIGFTEWGKRQVTQRQCEMCIGESHHCGLHFDVLRNLGPQGLRH
jgi:hypothetical protein